MNAVNESLTIIAMERRASFWHGRHMRRHRVQSGGIFLTIGILAGFGVGIGLGEPLRFTLIGTAAGGALALLIWILDMRRSG